MPNLLAFCQVPYRGTVQTFYISGDGSTFSYTFGDYMWRLSGEGLPLPKREIVVNELRKTCFSEVGFAILIWNAFSKDENKISSIQEYDQETGKIITISIYKRDGRTVSIIKKIDPVTEKVTSWVNNTNTSFKAAEPAKTVKPYITTRCYDNIKIMDNRDKEDIAKLIDNLYTNNLKFENI